MAECILQLAAQAENRVSVGYATRVRLEVIWQRLRLLSTTDLPCRKRKELLASHVLPPLPPGIQVGSDSQKSSRCSKEHTTHIYRHTFSRRRCPTEALSCSLDVLLSSQLRPSYDLRMDEPYDRAVAFHLIRRAARDEGLKVILRMSITSLAGTIESVCDFG